MQNFGDSRHAPSVHLSLFGVFMRRIISLFCLLLPLLGNADQLMLNKDAPDRYVVVKGDTLWDISAKFFRDPWRWPEIWGLNKETIKDPHWIYPGDIVYLDRATGTLRLGENAPLTNNTASGENAIEKLSPRVRIAASERDAIPEIPLKIIAPFLARPLVMDDKKLAKSPKIIGTYEERVLLGTDDIAYIEGMPNDQGVQWQVFRTGQTLTDPVTKEVLGYEVNYLGDSVVEKFDAISRIRITQARSEIMKGDQLVQASADHPISYAPHAPDLKVNARIVSIYGGILQASQNAVITINKGQRDGIENGHVLALYQNGEKLKKNGWFKEETNLPDVRYGLIIVFRVFEKVSYALVLQTRLAVTLQDTARNPD